MFIAERDGKPRLLEMCSTDSCTVPFHASEARGDPESRRQPITWEGTGGSNCRGDGHRLLYSDILPFTKHLFCARHKRQGTLHTLFNSQSVDNIEVDGIISLYQMWKDG